MNRPSTALALGALAALLAAGCSRNSSSPSGARKPVIGVALMSVSYEYIGLLNKVLEAHARELGVTLIVNDAQRSADRQVQQVENFVAQKVDAVILNPCEVEASSPGVDRALAAGIPVVNVNSETRSAPTAFVGSRDDEAGRLAMEHIARRLNGSGNVVMMHGFMGQAAQIKRDRGAREVLARHPGMKLLAEQTAEWDRAKGISLMENWIQSYGSRINAVFAQNDEMAMGAVLALEQAGRKKDVVVVGVDAIADAMQAVRDGRLEATVFQDAKGQGTAALDTALKIVRKEPYEKQVFIPFQLVTKDTLK